MRAGPLNKWVSLANATTTTPDSDGMYAALDPPHVFAAIEEQPPFNSGDRVTAAIVRMRFHPQVTVDTMITHTTPTITKMWFVKAVQNVGERNDELRLYCETVL